MDVGMLKATKEKGNEKKRKKKETDNSNFKFYFDIQDGYEMSTFSRSKINISLSLFNANFSNGTSHNRWLINYSQIPMDIYFYIEKKLSSRGTKLRRSLTRDIEDIEVEIGNTYWISGLMYMRGCAYVILD